MYLFIVYNVQFVYRGELEMLREGDWCIESARVSNAARIQGCVPLIIQMEL